MATVFAGHLPIQYEQLGTEEGFEINEYKIRQYMKAKYLQNNPEMKSVPPLLSVFSCCPQSFSGSLTMQKLLNMGFHFLTLNSR